ncbi:MAG: permease-like cell division protein FtsX, partial [Aeromonas sp.]
MAIVRHKQPLWRRLMMAGVDHVRQAFASLGELWRNPLASLMTLAVLGVS